MSDAVEAAFQAMQGRFNPWLNSQERLEAIRVGLAAADKARAVTDEEVVRILRTSRACMYEDAVAAFHAAGMKVVRA